MTRSKYSDSQIMAILKEASNGVPVANILRAHNISSATFISGDRGMVVWIYQ